MKKHRFLTNRLTTLFIILCMTGFEMAYSSVQVIPVPVVAEDLNVPHLAYNGHAVTFKAIARGFSNTTTAQASRFKWDFDGNGIYDTSPDVPRQIVSGTPDGTTAYDLGARGMLPITTSRKLFIATIELTLPDSTRVYATYSVLVFPDVPAQVAGGLPRPQDATSEQLGVMEAIALDDALWWAHLQMSSRAGMDAGITGFLASTTTDFTPSTTAAYLWLAEEMGHGPAYPPGAYQHNRNPGGWYRPSAPSADWLAKNDFRYRYDPYAETSVRALNYLLTTIGTVSSIPAEDEADDGTTAIPGTNDGMGLSNSPYHQGSWDILGVDGPVMAALASSQLAGTITQVGDTAQVQGRSIEHILQQMVDYTVFAQIDAIGQQLGGWCIFNIPNPDYGFSGRITAWEAIGLKAANGCMGYAGVYVNNRVRDRLHNYLSTDQNPTDKLARWWPGATSGELSVTGGFFCAEAMLGSNTFDANDPLPVSQDPTLPTITKGQARQRFDNYMSATGQYWVSNQINQYNMVCGLFYNDNGTNPTPYLRTDKRGNTEGIFLMARGLAALLASVDDVRGHDWRREFSIYLIRNQDVSGYWMDAVWPSAGIQTSMYFGQTLNTLLGGLAFAVHLNDRQSPVAIASASPMTIVAGPLTGTVNFQHTNSFHLEPARTIIEYQWLFDVSDADHPDFDSVNWNVPFGYIEGGLAWHSSDDSATPTHTYLVPGTYNAALRVIDDGAPSKSDIMVIPGILVTAPPNSAPIADAGDDQQAYPGQAVQLNGTAFDPDDDPITAWQWCIVSSPAGSTPGLSDTAISNPVFMATTPGEYVLSLTANDGNGWGPADNITIDVAYSFFKPIANPGGPYKVSIGEIIYSVQLDGSASYDPDQPGNSIAEYRWDLDGNGIYNDANTVTVVYSNPSWQAGRIYRIALIVIDNFGMVSNPAETTIQVIANEPPEATPTAIPSFGESPLIVQFAASASDPNEDTLTYVWDFGDPLSADNNSTLENPIHRYEQNGFYHVSLDICDGIATINRSITIRVGVYGIDYLLGDIDFDGDVDFEDFSEFTIAYLTENGDPDYNGDADFDCSNGYIDLYDFAILAAHWLKCTAPECD